MMWAAVINASGPDGKVLGIVDAAAGLVRAAGPLIKAAGASRIEWSGGVVPKPV